MRSLLHARPIIVRCVIELIIAVKSWILLLVLILAAITGKVRAVVSLIILVMVSVA